MDLLREFEKKQIKDIQRPRLRPGDIVRVATKVKEEKKARPQMFEGTIIGIRGGGPSTTFTVRREVAKYGVERIFPLYSPLITNIEILKRQKVRRAKLNYLRDVGRRRVKEDERAMQRHMHEEEERKRLELEKQKRAENEKEVQSKQEQEQSSPQESNETGLAGEVK